MLKLLVKKQLQEIFRSYFYNPKTGVKRSKGGIIAYFALFAVLIVGVIGGMFTVVSLALCGPLVTVDMGWLYFAILSGIAILFGAFGSVFNTYTGLYLSKDNDLLLSMPIPLNSIIASRLVSVYLMGVLYSSTVTLPMLIVYWIVAGPSAAGIICGLLLAVVISLIVLILSCLLGWCVAKISQKLKRKSFISVLASIVFIAAYYFFYYKAQSLITDLVANAQTYGAKIKGSAAFIYRFGRTGEGDFLSAAIVTGACLLLLFLVWCLLKRTFFGIAAGSGTVVKIRYKEKAAKQKGVFRALLSKELCRFTSSSGYMLNCGLGLLFIPVLGVLLLIKGPEIMSLLDAFLAEMPGAPAVVLICAFITLNSMADLSVPSVSLEGRSLWIPQSLPVAPKTVLWAKTALQLMLAGIPMLFTMICGCVVLNASALTRGLFFLVALLFFVFNGLFDAFLGIKMPILSWTNEMVPIKQSGAVGISIFGLWGVAAAFGVLYFFLGYKLGTELYLLIWAVILVLLSAGLAKWLNTKGADIFANL